MTPLITLSIVSHADSEKIVRLLASLQKHELNLGQFQIILTDNLGNDLPEIDSKLWDSFQIIRNEHKLGFAENHNRAYKKAEGEYFSILNPDLIFEESIFEKLITRLNTIQADLLAPQIVDAQNVIQDSFRGLPTPLNLIKRRLVGEQIQSKMVDAHGLIYPDWIAGMFWFMRSKTYSQLKGMDEKFRLYFEDVDFCTRARLAGLKLVVDTNLQVRHDAQRSSRKKIKYLFFHLMSAVQFFSSDVYHQARRKK